MRRTRSRHHRLVRRRKLILRDKKLQHPHQAHCLRLPPGLTTSRLWLPGAGGASEWRGRPRTLARPLSCPHGTSRRLQKRLRERGRDCPCPPRPTSTFPPSLTAPRSPWAVWPPQWSRGSSPGAVRAAQWTARTVWPGCCRSSHDCHTLTDLTATWPASPRWTSSSSSCRGSPHRRWRPAKRLKFLLGKFEWLLLVVLS